jgi:hypothetical protein
MNLKIREKSVNKLFIVRYYCGFYMVTVTKRTDNSRPETLTLDLPNTKHKF